MLPNVVKKGTSMSTTRGGDGTIFLQHHMHCGCYLSTLRAFGRGTWANASVKATLTDAHEQVLLFLLKMYVKLPRIFKCRKQI